MTADTIHKVWKKIGQSSAKGRCEVCGFTPEWYEGDDISCPHCGNAPEEVNVKWGFVTLPEAQPPYSAWRRG